MDIYCDKKWRVPTGQQGLGGEFEKGTLPNTFSQILENRLCWLRHLANLMRAAATGGHTLATSPSNMCSYDRWTWWNRNATNDPLALKPMLFVVPVVFGIGLER